MAAELVAGIIGAVIGWLARFGIRGRTYRVDLTIREPDDDPPDDDPPPIAS